MKYIIASLLAVGVWQFAAAGPVGECPTVEGDFPVMLPDSDSKSVFYVCINGQPAAKNCQGDLEFNAELRTCVAPVAYSPVGQCPPVDGSRPTYLPDSENKSIYYECVHGVPVPMQCPPDLVFNPNLNVCDWPVRTEKPRGKCPEGDEGVLTLLPDEANCATYYVCFAGKPFMATCPEGFVFNPEMKYCDFPANVRCAGDNDDEDKDDDDESQ